MAENLILIHSDTLVQMTGVKDAETDALLDDAVLAMSLFQDAIRHPASSLSFTSGGTHQVQVGDIIKEQAGDLASAVVEAVHVLTGSWAGGNAAGTFEVSSQNGVFTAAQLLDVGTEANVATASGESTGLAVVTEAAGAKAKIPMYCDDLTTSDFIMLEGTDNYDGIYAVDVVATGYVTIVEAYVAETLTRTQNIYIGVENGQEIALTHEGGDASGYYDGLLPHTLIGLIKGNYYYLFVKVRNAGDTVEVWHCYHWKADYYPGGEG